MCCHHLSRNEMYTNQKFDNLYVTPQSVKQANRNSLNKSMRISQEIKSMFENGGVEKHQLLWLRERWMRRLFNLRNRTECGPDA